MHRFIIGRWLLSINGIGPKIAIGALSSLPVTEIQNALSCGNVDVISSISGIGKKTAERIIVELKNIEGRSHKEIAEYLDISVTAAKVRLHRAHQKLRSILEDVEA